MNKIVLALCLTSAAAFSTSQASLRAPVRRAALAYSTTTGNTETVAGYIGGLTGLEAYDVGDCEGDYLMEADSLIIGAPTWHTGADDQRSGTSWDEFLYGTLTELDLSGKQVAIFGVGDSSSYADNFCDAAGELYDCFTKQGATVVGMVGTDDYDYVESKSTRDGKFVGMMFDEDNESDKSEERASKWIAQLKEAGMPGL